MHVKPRINKHHSQESITECVSFCEKNSFVLTFSQIEVSEIFYLDLAPCCANCSWGHTLNVLVTKTAQECFKGIFHRSQSRSLLYEVKVSMTSRPSHYESNILQLSLETETKTLETPVEETKQQSSQNIRMDGRNLCKKWVSENEQRGC